jgi:hypothetical protein
MTRFDWPQILGDLAHLLGEPAAGQAEAFHLREPCSETQLARSLEVARSTLRGWVDGAEPRHCDGERILMRWAELTGKTRAFAPTERRPLAGYAR